MTFRAAREVGGGNGVTVDLDGDAALVEGGSDEFIDAPADGGFDLVADGQAANTVVRLAAGRPDSRGGLGRRGAHLCMDRPKLNMDSRRDHTHQQGFVVTKHHLARNITSDSAWLRANVTDAAFSGKTVAEYGARGVVCYVWGLGDRCRSRVLWTHTADVRSTRSTSCILLSDRLLSLVIRCRNCETYFRKLGEVSGVSGTIRVRSGLAGSRSALAGC